MMCAACREAGDMLTDRKEGIPQLSAPMLLIVEAHRRCLYPESCTCQHGVGPQWVRP